MLSEQPRQVARPDPDPTGKLVDIAPIERAGLDQAERTLDRGTCTLPGGTERRCSGPASETGPEAGLLRGCGTAIEPDVTGQRCSRRTYRATVNACRFDRDEHHAVPGGVSAFEGLILRSEFEHATAMADESLTTQANCRYRVRKRTAHDRWIEPANLPPDDTSAPTGGAPTSRRDRRR